MVAVFLAVQIVFVSQSPAPAAPVAPPTSETVPATAAIPTPVITPTPVKPQAEEQVDPNPTHYFLSANALFPKPGEVRLAGLFQPDSVQSLFSASVGVTKWMTFDIGTILPIWLVGTRYPNTLVMAKFGGPLKNDFHWAAGIHGLSLISEGKFISGGAFFAVGTYARPWGNVSLLLATPYGLGTEMLTMLFPVIVSGSANVRLLSWLSVMSENYVFPLWSGGVVLLDAAGLRFIYKKLAVDVGVASLSTFTPSGAGMLPILPWLGVSRSF